MLSEKQVAALLGVSVAVIRKWRRCRAGPPWYRIGPSLIRYKPDEVAVYVEAGLGMPDARRR